MTALDPSPPAVPAVATAPSMVATVLATVPPLVFPIVGYVALALALRGGLLRAIEEAGWSAWLVLAMTFFASIVGAVLGALAARGLRVPAVVSLFVAVLPWITGLAGMRLGMHTASRAVMNADPASRATMIARGLSEAIHARILGAWSTASLAMALALSFAIAAAGQRADNRKWALAAVGFVLAVPLLGVTGYALATHAVGHDIVLLALMALGGVAVLPLATGTPAGDAPHGRAAALASSSVVLLFVGWLAGAAALGSQMLAEIFGAMANVDAGDRIGVLSHALDDLKITSTIGWVGGTTLALAALAVVGWAVTRSRPTVGRLVGGAALVAVAALALGADAFVRSASENDVARTAQPPWTSLDGFVPMELTTRGSSDTSASGEPLLLATDGLHAGMERVDTAQLDTQAGVARVARLVSAQLAAAQGDEPLPDWLRDQQFADGRERPQRDPAVGLAVDARVGAAALRAVVAGAAQGGAHSIVLTGTTRDADPAARAHIAAEAPALAALLSQPVSLAVLLEPALPSGYADADRMLWHATLDASGHGEIVPRSGAAGASLPYPTPPRTDESRFGPAPPGPHDIDVVYLALGDGATAASLAAAASAAAGDRYTPLVVAGAIPGNPERVAGLDDDAVHALLELLGGGNGPTGDTIGGNFGFGGLGGLGIGVQGGGTGGTGEGTIGLGNLGTIGHGSAHDEGDGPGAGPFPRVATGESDVRGSLSREVITRVVRRHVNEVRFCYERSLRDHPTLAGRVSVQFVIGASGTVQSASVQSSTLRNTEVEQCIADAVHRWQFPSPDGGGVVIVTYPFVLTADGERPTGAPPGYGLGGLGVGGS